MDTQQIIAALREERDRLEQAISALEGGGGRGRNGRRGRGNRGKHSETQYHANAKGNPQLRPQVFFTETEENGDCVCHA